MNKVSVDIVNLRDKVNDKLNGSGWENYLSPYINGLNFDYLVNKLVEGVNNGRRFTPKFKDVFNAFYECPKDDLKVVMVGQDPYPQLGVADGIAFSCSNKGTPEKSLQYINTALGTNHTDLKCWANQGVLLINTALTVEVNKIGSHYHLWESFIEYLFEGLNRCCPNTIFVLMGKKAQQLETLLPNCVVFKCTHPASAAYRGGTWDSNGVFEKVNMELTKQEKACIDW